MKHAAMSPIGGGEMEEMKGQPHDSPEQSGHSTCSRATSPWTSATYRLSTRCCARASASRQCARSLLATMIHLCNKRAHTKQTHADAQAGMDKRLAM